MQQKSPQAISLWRFLRSLLWQKFDQRVAIRESTPGHVQPTASAYVRPATRGVAVRITTRFLISNKACMLLFWQKFDQRAASYESTPGRAQFTASAYVGPATRGVAVRITTRLFGFKQKSQ
jgi:hypothetical protein